MLEWISQAGPLIYPLLGCSFLSLVIIIERSLYWWGKRRVQEDERLEEILQRLESGDLDEALALLPDSGEGVIRVLERVLAQPQGSAAEVLALAIAEEHRDMRRHMDLLETIITISPLLGILGTVTGIIHSFNFLGMSEVPAPQEVCRGIAEALLTTAAGLAIAIPALVFHNYFQSRINAWLERMSDHTLRLLILLDRQGERSRVSGG